MSKFVSVNRKLTRDELVFRYRDLLIGIQEEQRLGDIFKKSTDAP